MVDLVKFLRDTLGLELNKKFYVYKEVWKKRYTAMFTTSGINVADCPYSNEAILSEILFNPECSVEFEPLEDGAEQAVSEVEAFIDNNDTIRGARENKSALSYIRDYLNHQSLACESRLSEVKQSYEATISSLEEDLSTTKAVLNSIIWASNKAYKSDDVCLYGGQFYVADSNFISGANFADDVNWQLVKHTSASAS